MNLITLTDDDFIGETRVRLSDYRFIHLRDVLQAASKDQIKVGRLSGLIGHGVITTLTDTAVEMDISLTDTPPPKLPLTVILSLPRPKMIRRIFRSVAEFGIEQLIIINSYKVEKSYWQSPVLADEKVRQYFVDGLQQARDTVLPQFSSKRLFKPFIEDELPELIRGKRALLAHPGIGQPCPVGIGEPSVLAIGPEGGFTPYEVEKFLQAGFEGVHLGPRILRVENALSALVSKLY